MIICLYVERIRELRLVFKHSSAAAAAAAAFDISMWIRSFRIIFSKKKKQLIASSGSVNGLVEQIVI